jgi:hypothetical protein
VPGLCQCPVSDRLKGLHKGLNRFLSPAGAGLSSASTCQTDSTTASPQPWCAVVYPHLIVYRQVDLVGLTREVETPSPSNSPHDHMILRVDLVVLTREVETPSPSNSPHDHMILRVDLVGLTREVETPLPSNHPRCDQVVHTAEYHTMLCYTVLWRAGPVHTSAVICITAGAVRLPLILACGDGVHRSDTRQWGGRANSSLVSRRDRRRGPGSTSTLPACYSPAAGKPTTVKTASRCDPTCWVLPLLSTPTVYAPQSHCIAHGCTLAPYGCRKASC